MATRSLINVKHTDGQVHSIYCHFDGADHLPILTEHYNTQEDAEALVSLGDLSVLAPRLSPRMGEVHSFDKPKDDICIAYGRDRGEDGVDASIYHSFEAARRQTRGAQYVYEFEGEWRRLRV